MSEIDDILAQVPVDQIAQELGVDPSEVLDASRNSIPALLGGLQANAADSSGAESIIDALGQHTAEPQSLNDINQDDGSAIVSHIFGTNTDQVTHQLGGLGGNNMGPLIQKLLPILAPIVMAWLAKQFQQRTGGAATDSSAGSTTQDGGSLFPGGTTQAQTPAQPADTGAASNPLQDILGQVLGGALGGGSGSSAGGGGLGGQILTQVLGGLLGGGRR